MAPVRHFLELTDFSANELQGMIDLAIGLKATNRHHPAYLERRVLLTLSDKFTSRTRAASITAMTEMGGNADFMTFEDTQLGIKESVEHGAGYFSRVFCATVLRVSDPTILDEFARSAVSPVINGMTDNSHPCQIMADLMTVQEKLGNFKNKKFAWFGDYNNMSKTYIQAARIFGFELTLAIPPEHMPTTNLNLPENIVLTTNPVQAAIDADVFVTDVWVSKGQPDKDRDVFRPYQVNAELMEQGKTGALFMHCMPVNIGQEVTQDVLASPASVIFDEAENRKHILKAILLSVLDIAGKTPAQPLNHKLT